ncbi:MAG: hypothetical protein O2961_06000 [Bacteroidetes bacterium]|nr:hypothetical protein [Bacteroidota bacterium]
MKQSLWHLGQLLVVVCTVGSIHLVTILYLNSTFPARVLFQLYSVNFIMAITGYAMIRMAYWLKSQVEGFVFLLGSFIKFGVLYGVFLANETAAIPDTKQAFLHLFVPYAVCLIWEIATLAKILNQAPKSSV